MSDAACSSLESLIHRLNVGIFVFVEEDEKWESRLFYQQCISGFECVRARSNTVTWEAFDDGKQET